MLVKLTSVLTLIESAALYGGAETNGKYWLFDTMSGRHFRLNRLGYFALSLIDGRRSVDDIIGVCIEKFDINHDAASKDLVEFFQECAANKMIKPVKASGGVQPDRKQNVAKPIGNNARRTPGKTKKEGEL